MFFKDVQHFGVHYCVSITIPFPLTITSFLFTKYLHHVTYCKSEQWKHIFCHAIGSKFMCAIYKHGFCAVYDVFYLWNDTNKSTHVLKEKSVFVTWKLDENGVIQHVKLEIIPSIQLWFERIWKRVNATSLSWANPLCHWLEMVQLSLRRTE